MEEFARVKDNHKSEDRILVLKRMEGKKTLDAAGLVDPRLFEGKNRLHAFRSKKDNLWHMRYDHGALPGGLQTGFTNFNLLMEHTKAYFGKRNIEIQDVLD